MWHTILNPFSGIDWINHMPSIKHLNSWEHSTINIISYNLTNSSWKEAVPQLRWAVWHGICYITHVLCVTPVAIQDRVPRPWYSGQGHRSIWRPERLTLETGLYSAIWTWWTPPPWVPDEWLELKIRALCFFAPKVEYHRETDSLLGS